MGLRCFIYEDHTAPGFGYLKTSRNRLFIAVFTKLDAGTFPIVIIIIIIIIPTSTSSTCVAHSTSKTQRTFAKTIAL